MKKKVWLVSILGAAAVVTLILPSQAEARLQPRQPSGSGAYYAQGGYLIGSKPFTRMRRIRVCGILPKTVCRRYQLPAVKPLLPRVSTDERPHKVLNLGYRKKTKI